MFSITYDNNDVQNELQKMQEFSDQLKQKKKKLDQKTKFQKALRGIKNNTTKSSHGKNAHGLGKSSKSSSLQGAKKPDVSFMYAMVVALVAQMNTNLQSMGVQAQHVQFLDENNEKYTSELNSLQSEASGIKDYTDEDSLLKSSDISSQMNILGNNFTSNQEDQMKDSGALQSLQTNSSSESGVGQSLLDLDKQIFRQVHFGRG